MLVLGAGMAAAEEFTYVDLVNRLTDLKRLAELPAPDERCLQWSSYDRASRYDEASGKYVDWTANGDGSGYLREENGAFVFAEMKGPGCIWRMWSARPEDGHVRIYLDGAETPVVDLPFRGFFNGQNEPFTRNSLVYEAGKGWNNYTPIPFQKSCRITADEGWGAYFHFTYTTYPDRTILPTFTGKLNQEENAALDAVNERFANLGTEPVFRQKPVKLPPDEDVIVTRLTGRRAITAIKIKPELPASVDDRKLLREVVLKVNWDGDEKPAIWSPLGDFFGTAPGANAYLSFPMGLTEDGWFYSHWYMPFNSEAVIRLQNEGKETRRLLIEVLHEPIDEPIDNLGRFHAKWHGDAFLPPEPERWIDWTILSTRGRGRFCGVALHVWNPRGGWWGEGDEKFHVDGEKFPSTIGTGSEDYFGYAWCTPALFQRAYHNQTLVSNNIGHVSVNRWQIVDNIPFQTSFQGYIEKYYKNDKPTLYDAVAYWYQEASGPNRSDAYEAVPLDRRMVWPEPEVFAVKGALEGENLKILRKTAGNPRSQDMTGFGDSWSRLAHLWWTDAQPGDRLELAIPVRASGDYGVTLRLTKAPDYGIVQLYLDGAKTGDPIDLYATSVIISDVVDLGRHTLTEGEHVLAIEIVAANEEAEKAYMAGLDYVKLDPVSQ